MKSDISKTIIFRFTNRFTKQEIMRVVMPYLPFLAASGYYSRSYKAFKDNAAIGFEKGLVSGKHFFTTDKKDRTVISLPSGMSLDFPYDINEQDRKIILHQLEGVKMSLA